MSPLRSTIGFKKVAPFIFDATIKLWFLGRRGGERFEYNGSVLFGSFIKYVDKGGLGAWTRPLAKK